MPLTPHLTDAPNGTPPAAAAPRRRAMRRRLPLLLRRRAAAAFVGVSVPTWDRDTAAGRNPAPLRVVGRTYWRTAELIAWVRHGCPPRREWIATWDAMQERRGHR